MMRPEFSLQKAVTEFLNVALPDNSFWTSFPAGGGGRIRGAQLRASGLKAGVPDLLVLYQGAAIFMELKAPKGRVSAEQLETGRKIEAAGCQVYVCRSVDEVAAELAHAGVPLRTLGGWMPRKRSAA